MGRLAALLLHVIALQVIALSALLAPAAIAQEQGAATVAKVLEQRRAGQSGLQRLH